MKILSKKALRIVAFTAIASVVAVGAVGCGSKSSESSLKDEKKIVKIGVVGSDTDVWDYVKDKLAKDKEPINIELVKFSDYNQPNDALANGDIDLNSFQHRIFLDNYNKEKKQDLTPIGDTVIAPLGIYSEKIKDVKDLKDGAKVVIPNDPTNGGRALLLLQTAGLIKVNDKVGNLVRLKDITENPKHLNITEVDAAQTARSLKDVDISIINSGMAVDAGFVPKKDAIFLEPVNEKSKPYVNIIVSRSKDKDNKIYKKIVEAYQQDDVKKVIEKTSKGSSIPAWENK